MSKKTIGIITFHTALNYGAVLQAYALKKVCDRVGYEAHIVDYRYTGISEEVAPVKAFLDKSSRRYHAVYPLIRGMMSYPGDKKREKEFCEFRKKYLAESGPCTNEEDIADLDYDILVSGSDQIWNYRITGEKFDPVFFLKMNSDAQKVIYAASAHDTPFPLDMELKLKEMLAESDAAISIREKKLADYTAKITGNVYPVVLDPTLLAGREIIEEIPTSEPPEKPYILLYQIDANPTSDISVRTLEEKFGCDVYTMTVPRLGDTHGRRGDCGPEKFLSLLKGAKFLVTNSFHGIALSLILEKQFYVYENGGVMSRIDSLLQAVDLCGRKVKMVADIDQDNTIDFVPVQRKLTALREQSMEFLQKALAGETYCTLPTDEKVVPTILPMAQREKKDCSGCSACVEICPVNAIGMARDEEGFFYPQIDETACIRCGKCDKVCGFHPFEERETGFELPKAFGIKHKDDAVRQTSRSGAAFVAFSDIVLKNGGSIYGAAMTEDFHVAHIRAVTAAQRDQMKTAKYVQSDIRGIFPQVVEDLEAGKPVLFSGTPCQVAGLREMLDTKHIDSQNLICCDLVCHGVPSPKVWEDYLEHIATGYRGRILEANFRDKSFGWDSHCESFVVEGRKKKAVSRDYTDLFYDHIMFRPSCHNCQFANVNRAGDLTLADFWGIEKNDASFNDNRGVSLVLVSSAKGVELLEQAKESLQWFECDIRNCLQPTLVKPSVASPRREQFWKDYQTITFERLLKKYTEPLTLPGKVKKRIKKVMYHTGLRKHP